MGRSCKLTMRNCGAARRNFLQAASTDFIAERDDEGKEGDVQYGTRRGAWGSRPDARNGGDSFVVE
jgi:hypothetical protein